ncbi:tRNA uridine-5-carboxymethylaminomethyl(34) synthesis GTPase MnmE, partial [Flavobacterium sp.]|uniref:tRNA uridine-5-carboxymethylaminomethyl(34) synthesis GTPase MnmE n=1 Tax=Flavobacterium sp. TaxID=239 RepID=UPI002636C473
MTYQDNIVALATPSGAGAIAIVRISGSDAVSIAAKVFRPLKAKELSKQKTHTLHLGHIVDGDKVIDEVLLSLFKGPHSYTGENTIELSCHGSPYIQQQLIQLLLRNGCRMAQAGEFTLRAFLNGKLDLSQAEAVADLIASDNEASHQIAMQQMRGGFSNEIAQLRTELLNFASLIELELDFAEEDVAFADRSQFRELLDRIERVLKRLIDSFATGNVIKNGIPVAIVGEPNVGKSTLLNALLNEERAIVSDIAGTTRDTIEDELVIGGIGFRFIDTAGIRETVDVVESIGIRKTFEKMEQAQVVVYLIDNGQLIIDNEELTTNNEELIINNEELTINNEELIINNEELTTNNEELIINNEELTTSNEELIINNEELTTNNEELRINNEELTLNNEELIINNEELTTNNEELIINNEELTTSNEE